MKLCFSTLCCLDKGPDDVINYAKSNGICGIEIRVNNESKALGNRTINDADEIRNKFADADINIIDFALSCNISGYDKEQLNIGLSGIDFAALAGAKAVRIFVGSQQNKIIDKVRVDYDGIIEAVREISSYGKKKNIEIWLETHSSFSSGKSMSNLVDNINCDNVKVIWDVIHSLEYHESPEETINYLGDKIAHIHLKDGKSSEDKLSTQFIHTDLGKGIVQVETVVSLLNNIGFDGYYSLEWESPWRNEIRDLYNYIDSLLKSYKKYINVN